MRRAAIHEVIHQKGSPMVEETLSRVIIAGSTDISELLLPATLDGVGLVLIDMFRARETSVDEIILRDELARKGVVASFDRESTCFSTLRAGLKGETGSAVVTLRKSFGDPDGPLCNVPRAGTNDESVEASTGGSWRRFGDEDMRAITTRSEIPLFRSLRLIGDTTGNSATRIFSETVFGSLSWISELSCTGNGI
jgi:hypothetical protein